MTRDAGGQVVPVYAVCPAGNQRWLWVAWDTSEEAHAGESPQASGYALTAAAAEAKALEWAGAQADALPSRWASEYRRRLGARVRPGRAAIRDQNPAQARAAASRPEFVYCVREGDPHDPPGHHVISRHRVVKKTAGKLHIDPEPYQEPATGNDADAPSIARPVRSLIIDRAILRREGRHRHPRSHREVFFYPTEREGIRDFSERHTPDWCRHLGLSFPCSLDDVKKAYRRLAKGAHPDAGGDPTRFLAVEQAYRDALAHFAQHPDPS